MGRHCLCPRRCFKLFKRVIRVVQAWMPLFIVRKDGVIVKEFRANSSQLKDKDNRLRLMIGAIYLDEASTF